jgi:hypothetical protein
MQGICHEGLTVHEVSAGVSEGVSREATRREQPARSLPWFGLSIFAVTSIADYQWDYILP